MESSPLPPWIWPRAAYIHVPFCAHHCGYCDFAIAVGQDAQIDRYLQALGMDAKAVSENIGVASAIKMCRSVIIKGLEALAVESMFAARHFGAEDAVLASLAASYPQMGWNEKLPDYPAPALTAGRN